MKKYTHSVIKEMSRIELIAFMDELLTVIKMALKDWGLMITIGVNAQKKL